MTQEPVKGPATPEELSSRKVRFAVIGTGNMGGTHARNLAGSDLAEVTWLCDIDLDRAHAIQNEIGGKVTADMDEACQADDVDVVLVALPTGSHRLGVEAACRARKHIFCEKPIARTNEDAAAMVAMCHEAGVQLMIGHVVRFFPEYIRAKEEVDSGVLGDIAIARGFRLNPPVMLDRPWFADVEVSGGVVLDLMIHEIDVFRWFFGEVERIFAHGLSFDEIHTRRDHAVASLRFRSGVIGHLEASWAHSAWRTMLEIAGSTGLYDFTSTDAATLTLEPTVGVAGDYLGASGPVLIPMRPSPVAPHLAEILAYIEALRAGEPSPVSGEDGLRTLIVANAVLDSMKDHQPRFFNEDGTVRQA